MVTSFYKVDDNGNISISNEARQVEPYKSIIIRDKGSKGDAQGRKKHMAMKELAYIHWMCHSTSPFMVHKKVEERSDQVKLRVGLPESWKPDQLIIDAMEQFKEDTHTKYDEVLASAYYSLFKVKDYFDNANPTLPNFDFKTYKDALTSLDGMFKGLEDLKTRVEKERFEKVKKTSTTKKSWMFEDEDD